MPIYEYRCESCGREKEFLQKVSDAPLTTCPFCGQDALKKLISAAGFQLKGSGWYATDFKGASKSRAKEATEKPKEDAGKESKTESSEAKPATPHTCGGGCSHA
jgi:putative FmdB family regulatory protein